MDISIPNLSMTEAVSIGVALAVLIKTKLSSMKRAENRDKIDDAETTLAQAQNDAATKFVQDLISEHRRVVIQLQSAEKDRTTNAQKIGELSTEVTLLRDQVLEVKNLLDRLSRELDESRRKNNEKEGLIIRLEAERDSALQQLANRRAQDRERLSEQNNSKI